MRLISFRWIVVLSAVLILSACKSNATPTPAPVMNLPTVGVASGTPIFTQIPFTGEPGAEASQQVNCTPTEADDEGPYYKEGAPLKQKLEPDGAEGNRLIVQGMVYGVTDNGCVPLPGAIVDVWQAGPDGQYDFSDNFLYRGKVQADQNGHYSFETIVPPQYEDRPAHIHLKASADKTNLLTTQLYFEGDSRIGGLTHNDTPRVLQPADQNGILVAVFNIILTFNS